MNIKNIIKTCQITLLALFFLGGTTILHTMQRSRLLSRSSVLSSIKKTPKNTAAHYYRMLTKKPYLRQRIYQATPQLIKTSSYNSSFNKGRLFSTKQPIIATRTPSTTIDTLKFFIEDINLHLKRAPEHVITYFGLYPQETLHVLTTSNIPWQSQQQFLDLIEHTKDLAERFAPAVRDNFTTLLKSFPIGPELIAEIAQSSIDSLEIIAPALLQHFDSFIMALEDQRSLSGKYFPRKIESSAPSGLIAFYQSQLLSRSLSAILNTPRQDTSLLQQLSEVIVSSSLEEKTWNKIIRNQEVNNILMEYVKSSKIPPVKNNRMFISNEMLMAMTDIVTEKEVSPEIRIQTIGGLQDIIEHHFKDILQYASMEFITDFTYLAAKSYLFPQSFRSLALIIPLLKEKFSNPHAITMLASRKDAAFTLPYLMIARRNDNALEKENYNRKISLIEPSIVTKGITQGNTLMKFASNNDTKEGLELIEALYRKDPQAHEKLYNIISHLSQADKENFKATKLGQEMYDFIEYQEANRGMEKEESLY